MKKLLFFLCALVALSAAAQHIKPEVLKKFAAYHSQYNRLRNEGKSDSVMYFARLCLQIAQQQQHDSLLNEAYNNMGNAFAVSSDFPLALEYYFKSLATAEKMNDPFRVGVVAGNISFNAYQVGDFQTGLTYGKRAADVLLQLSGAQTNARLPYYRALSNAYDNIGVNFIGFNKPDSALKYLQLAYAAVLMAEDLYNKTAILTDLARTYELLNEKRMAEDYFRESIYLGDSLQLPTVLSYAAMHYGNFLWKQKRYQPLQEVGRKGIDAAIHSGERSNVIGLAALLQHAYDATGDRDSAYHFAKMLNLYRDSVYSTHKLLAAQHMVFKRQSEEQQALRDKEKAAVERTNNLQYVAIAFSLIVLLTLFLVFSHSIIANQKLIKFLGVIALLVVFEFLNLLLHPWLGEITHHSPVLMLLAMVCVAALLIPLHHKLEHWIIHRLVEKNNRIRLAAAKRVIATLEKQEQPV